MIEQQFLKLFLSNSFYKSVKDKIPQDAFTDFGAKLLETIAWAQEQFQRDLSLIEVKELHFSRNPGMTTSQKHTFDVMVANIEALPPLKEDAAQYILSGLWRTSLGARIVALGTDYVNGSLSDLNELKKLIEGTQDDFMPDEFVEPITGNVIDLVSQISQRPSWTFNLSTLAEKIPGMSAGELFILLARPEQGKTAWLINMAAGPGGFAEQGANVHFICNEEPAIRHAFRAVSSFTGFTADTIRTNPSAANSLFAAIRNNITFFDDVTMDLQKLERHCKHFKPDIMIIDQLANVRANGFYKESHERIKEIYQTAREIGKQHNVLMVAAHQASAEAEGKSKVHYSMAEGSKTALAATGDVILGLGSATEETDIRTGYVSKNKISGWHGSIAFKLLPQLSRYVI